MVLFCVCEKLTAVSSTLNKFKSYCSVILLKETAHVYAVSCGL